MKALEAQQLRLQAIAAAAPEAKRLLEVTILPGLIDAAKEGRGGARLAKSMCSGDPAVHEAVRLELVSLGYTCMEPDGSDPDDGTFLIVRWI